MFYSDSCQNVKHHSAFYVENMLEGDKRGRRLVQSPRKTVAWTRVVAFKAGKYGCISSSIQEVEESRLAKRVDGEGGAKGIRDDPQVLFLSNW